MLYITQLIYLNDGEEAAFNEFESHAIPLIAKYNGALELRIRPDDAAYIEAGIEKPYEIHLVRFNTEKDFQDFMADDSRQLWLPLKTKAIRESFLIQGKKL